MSPLLEYFWPVFAAGLLFGAIAGTLAMRSSPARRTIAAGVAGTLLAALIWSGPAGAADRFIADVERPARYTLVYYEVPQVQAKLQRAPLTRRIVLSGPADDFQRTELVRIMDELSGVSGATWSESFTIPLIAEAFLAGLGGFLLGALLAYVVALRRRYNAQWRW